MKLRDYQEECIDAALSSKGNALCVLPTGAGKSVVVAGLIQRILSLAPVNILVLQHRKELVEQNYEKFVKLCPLEILPQAGIYSASVGIKQIGNRITFAQIQSIHNKAEKLPIIHYCIVDEVHRIKHEDAGMYRDLIRDLKERNPKMGICGLTATPFRTASGIIMEGKEPLFPELTYEVGMRPLMEKGYLSRLVSKFGEKQADLSKVGIRKGEYVLSEMEDAISPLTEAACDEIVTLGTKRRHWLLFCPGVKTATDFARALVQRGIKAEVIHGQMDKKEREAVLARFKAGETKAVTNCDILTEGFDFEGLDLVAILRGTKSPGLFVQMCGRGLRAHQDKRDCLILDFAGNLERFGAVDCIKVRKSKFGFKLVTKPLKNCPQCGVAVPINHSKCECGYMFERLSANHEVVASERPVLSEVRELEVRWIGYKVHNKSGKPPSLKVLYETSTKETIREFICFEHEGYAKKKAYQWWKINRKSEGLLPINTQEAFFRAPNEMKPVRKIKVQPDGKFWKIVSKEYGEVVKEESEGDRFFDEEGVNI